MVAKQFPQTAYAGLAWSLQLEWQYLQRVTPGIAESFSPIEDAIATEFLPALFDATAKELAPHRTSDVLPDPRDSSVCSLPCSSHFQGPRAAHKLQLEAQEAELKSLLESASPADARRVKRSAAMGAWLTTLPNTLNGTELSLEEFQDILRLRFGLLPAPPLRWLWGTVLR